MESTLEQIKAGEIKASDLPQITVIELQGQGYVSQNNRRLWVLKRCKGAPFFSPNKAQHLIQITASPNHHVFLAELGLLPGGTIPCRVQSASARSRRDRSRLGADGAAPLHFAREARFTAPSSSASRPPPSPPPPT